MKVKRQEFFKFNAKGKPRLLFLRPIEKSVVNIVRYAIYSQTMTQITWFKWQIKTWFNK